MTSLILSVFNLSNMLKLMSALKIRNLKNKKMRWFKFFVNNLQFSSKQILWVVGYEYD